MDPLSRMLLLIGGGASAIYLGRAGFEVSAATIRVVVLVCGILLAGVVVVMTFSYTEIDCKHIAETFRIGGSFHFEIFSVRWEDIQNVEAGNSVRPKTTNLRVVLKNGKIHKFTATRNSNVAEAFGIIVNGFLEHV